MLTGLISCQIKTGKISNKTNWVSQWKRSENWLKQNQLFSAHLFLSVSRIPRPDSGCAKTIAPYKIGNSWFAECKRMRVCVCANYKFNWECKCNNIAVAADKIQWGIKTETSDFVILAWMSTERERERSESIDSRFFLLLTLSLLSLWPTPGIHP